MGAVSDATIAAVTAWEALDSRGTPTVACEITLRGGARGAAIVPSGASTGAHEAHELRDGGERFGGRGVRTAVSHVKGQLAAAVAGCDATDQAEVDRRLRAADGTANLSRLGANAVLSVSIAVAVAAAHAADLPLHRFVADPGAAPLLPLPMVNIVSGGAHAGWSLDIQDVLAVPVGAQSFAQAIEWAWRVRRGTAEVLEARGLPAALVADEGGLGPHLQGNRDALELVATGIERSGLRAGEDVAIAVDVAASELVDPNGRYRLQAEGRTLRAADLVAELQGWAAELPIVSLEDPLAEDDWSAWRTATAALGHVQLVGDDLFVTSEERLRRGIEQGVANAVLVKPNQIGTLSDARAVVAQAHRAGYRTVLSARSGETEDAWLADLAVGWRTGQIKVGSTTRSERTAKWNRLLEIEAGLGDAAEFAGRAALAGRTVD
jgi:enolase